MRFVFDRHDLKDLLQLLLEYLIYDRLERFRIDEHGSFLEGGSE